MRKPSTISTNTSSPVGFRPLCLRNETGSLLHASTSLIIASMWSASNAQREHNDSDCLCLRKVHNQVCDHKHFLTTWTKTDTLKSNRTLLSFSETLLSYCLNPRLSSGTTDSSWGIQKAFSLSAAVLKKIPERIYRKIYLKIRVLRNNAAVWNLLV